MRTILVHFNMKLLGLGNSVRNTQNPDKTDPNYARLTVFHYCKGFSLHTSY